MKTIIKKASMSKFSQHQQNDEVLQLVAVGSDENTIINYLLQKYSITEANAKSIIKRAYKHLREQFDERSEELADKVLLQYSLLYKKAVDDNQIRTAKDVLDSIVRLKGLAKAEKVEITTKSQIDLSKYSDEDLKMMLDVNKKYNGQ